MSRTELTKHLTFEFLVLFSLVQFSFFAVPLRSLLVYARPSQNVHRRQFLRRAHTSTHRRYLSALDMRHTEIAALALRTAIPTEDIDSAQVRLFSSPVPMVRSWVRSRLAFRGSDT